ncbi:glycosyltransferase family 4 protein [Niabella drilacis]|uniref:Glycosyltransferase involved in cell wall bisynthesis n=1 Tax=Niabella drilacis (strain DSM 25811 / CCM 8410 / CCUG 62505 / LMG 26954 / E90) TaxID=1285928 RepID=A0A1G6QTM1_NIADE|nr:glycosyltransferase family 4 protein [Niabella drilacis]SDC95682.1 Glycosyltransferase involved in cell wall bisynthesis [Niabella drilacis]
MKVLQVVSVAFSLRYFIGDQFEYFAQRGVSYSVACSPSEQLSQYAEEMKFKAVPININRSISPLQDVASIFKLYSLIKREQFDVVIAHSPKGGLIGMMAALMARTPKRIFFRHGLVFETTSGFKRKLLIFIEKITGACANNVVNVSPSIAEKSVRLKLNSPSKNLLLARGTCNGVNVSKYKRNPALPRSSRAIIGFIGRLCRDKGIVELVEAWKLLLPEFQNIELLLVGPYDERDTLPEETVQFIQSCSSITQVGEVAQTISFYDQMDIFVLPSYREGFPTVVLEASSMELPVITTRNTGCIDSIIENSTGLFTDLTPQDIAENIKRYLTNEPLRRIHGKNGREFVTENFSEEIIYKEIETKILK